MSRKAYLSLFSRALDVILEWYGELMVANICIRPESYHTLFRHDNSHQCSYQNHKKKVH